MPPHDLWAFPRLASRDSPGTNAIPLVDAARAYDDCRGKALPVLKHMLGHASIEMTAHYIGLDLKAMADGSTRFESLMRPHVTPPSVHEIAKITT